MSRLSCLQTGSWVAILFILLLLPVTVAGATAQEDTIAPGIISGPQVEEVTGLKATIVWETDEPATSIVEYGLDESYGESEEDVELVTDHRVVIGPLQPETTYHYRVGSKDEAGNGPTYSGDLTFTTVSGPSLAELDTMFVQLVKPDGRPVGRLEPVVEAIGLYRLRAFPFPLNVLNGGFIELPEDAFDGNINLTIKLPEFARIAGNEVDFGEVKVISAVTFEVTVGGSLVDPFWFKNPVKLRLPYKYGLLKNLGFTEDNLSMFFYSEEAGFDSTGISNVRLDTESHWITADLAHFSTVVVTDKEATLAVSSSTWGQIKSLFRED